MQCGAWYRSLSGTCARRESISVQRLNLESSVPVLQTQAKAFAEGACEGKGMHTILLVL
jgi:hypothetical protein